MKKLESNITNDGLRSLTNKLKRHSLQWAPLLADEISSTKEWQDYSNQPLTIENLRKISDGTIKSNKHRRMFIECGLKLLDKFELEAKEDRKLLKKLK